MKRLKMLLISLGAISALVLPSLAFVAPVGAIAVNEELCKGINFAGGDGDSCEDNGEAEDSVRDIINTVIDIFSIVVGAVSVIMIILGGLRYITSAGDSSNVTSAKNTILYAIVGLVIVIFAQTIVKFVVGRISGDGS